jgi:hypothetical protein
MTRYYRTISVIVALGGLGALLAAIGGAGAGELEEQPAEATVSPAVDPPDEQESHSVGEEVDVSAGDPDEDRSADLDTSSEDLEDAEGRTADGVQPTPDEAVAVDPEGVRGSELTKAPGFDTPESRVEDRPPTSPRPAYQGVGDGGVQPAGGGEERELRGGGGPRAPIFDAATMKLSFQAYLTDNNGDALPGPTVDLQFNIYNGIGGVVEGPIAMAGVTISDGVVDVMVPVSASSFDGTERLLGVTVNPPAAELAPRIPLVSVPHAIRVDRVENPELTDHVELGTAADNGSLTVFNAGIGAPSVTIDGSISQMSFYGWSNGLEGIRLFDRTYGELRLYDDDSDEVVRLSATGNSGGQLTLRDETAVGGDSVFLDGGTGTINAEGSLNAVDTIGGTVQGSLYTNSFGAWLDLRDETGALTIRGGPSDTAGGGFMHLYQADGDLGMVVDGDASTDAGGVIRIYQADGSIGLTLDGDEGGADGGGVIKVDDAGGSWRVVLDGESTGTGGEISVFDDDGTETVEILGAETSSQGAQITLRKADGTPTIELDADFNGDGRIITQELQITGGSDLSEQFDVRNGGGEVKSGMVVCIDPASPGKLVVSGKGYDRRVAGIISGAGGVETGLYMGQKGTPADGSYPVALTGRVYCWCDASDGAITPGDLLTTSDTPGHAMKVADHAKAQGAIIGKAMTSLEHGQGLVLVLVSLQ